MNGSQIRFSELLFYDLQMACRHAKLGLATNEDVEKARAAIKEFYLGMAENPILTGYPDGQILENEES